MVLFKKKDRILNPRFTIKNLISKLRQLRSSTVLHKVRTFVAINIPTVKYFSINAVEFIFPIEMLNVCVCVCCMERCEILQIKKLLNRNLTCWLYGREFHTIYLLYNPVQIHRHVLTCHRRANENFLTFFYV